MLIRINGPHTHHPGALKYMWGQLLAHKVRFNSNSAWSVWMAAKEEFNIDQNNLSFLCCAFLIKCEIFLRDSVKSEA